MLAIDVHLFLIAYHMISAVFLTTKNMFSVVTRLFQNSQDFHDFAIPNIANFDFCCSELFWNSNFPAPQSQESSELSGIRASTPSVG
jgi:hypothetical protein